MVPAGRGSESAQDILTSDETREFFALMLKERNSGWLYRSRVRLHRSLQFLETGDPPSKSGGSLQNILPPGQPSGNHATRSFFIDRPGSSQSFR
jgi:hypothetical protein